MNKRKLYLCLIIMQVIVMIFSIVNYFVKKDNLYSQQFVCTDMVLYGGELDDSGVLHINSDNAVEGVVATIYLPELERSRYRVWLSYESTAENSFVFAKARDLSEILFEANNANIQVGNGSIELPFVIKGDSKQAEINIYYSGTGVLNLYGLEMEQTTHVYKQDIFKAFVFCLLCWLFMYLYQSNMKQRKIVLGLIFIALVSSNLVFINYLLGGHDLGFHLNRIESMFVGLQQGVFPVKIQSSWLNGYGYPVGVFYGDLLLYIAVFMRFMGFSVQASYHIFVIFVNFLTTFIAYYSFNRLFKNENMGLAGSAIYVLSLYRLENMYSRAAVGEYCAITFLPLILVGMYEILKDNKEKRVIPAPLLFALGLSGIIHSHILSCVIVAGFILLTCIVFIKKVLKPSVFIRLVTVVGLTLLFSLDFIVPFLDYYTLDFKVNSASWGTTYIQNMGMHMIQIFAMFINAQGAGYYPSYGIAAEMTVGVGIVPLVGLLLFIYLILNNGKKAFKNSDYKLAIYTFALFIISIFASTCYFPWDQISHMHELFEKVIGMLQFPWRFLAVAVLFSTVFICIALKELKETLTEGLKFIPAILVIISVAFTAAIYSNSFMLDDIYGNPFFIYEASDLNFTQVYTGEYLPEGTDTALLAPNKIITTENVEYSDYMKNDLKISCHVSSGEKNGYIEFPLLYYKGYTVSADAGNENFYIGAGDNNVVRVTLPEKYEGNIKVSFEEPIYWRVAEIITLISSILAFLYLLKNVWSFKLKDKYNERRSKTE